MRILGIETSCDETAAAVVEVARGQFSVLSNVVASQIKIHAKTGGVVPEVAAREHIKAILPVVKKAIRNNKVDVIAVTTGPGLATSLSVGMETARTLAYVWKKPIVAVNHLAGHIYANWLKITPHETVRSHHFVRLCLIEFPALCLIVSGGHTELVLMKKHLDFKVIGSTRDDAAGEAFDKVAKMLKLGYPGGPAISDMAEKCKIKNVKCKMMLFPRPMINSSDFDFSFSGLKTAVLYYIKTLKHENIKTLLPEICYAFQEAVADVLVSKTIRAAKEYKVKTVLLGGGVAANIKLREEQKSAIADFCSDISFFMPPIQYTTDNAVMIAVAGYFMARAKQFTSWEKLDIDPNWELGQKPRLLTR